MGEIINVNPQKMKEYAEKIREKSSEYRNIGRELLDCATNMGEAYKGKDNLEYVKKVEGFTEDIDKMVEKLKLVSDALEEQANNYINNQNANIDAAQQLHG